MTVRIRRASTTSGYRHLIRPGAQRAHAGDADAATADPLGTDAPPGRFVGSGVALLRGADTAPGNVPVSAETFVLLLDTAATRIGSGEITGFDLTFSVPKSVSVAWALADSHTRAIVYDAHVEAVGRTLEYAEQSIFAHRGATGTRVAGLVGAAFDHWDSRAGDPQLHTHVVVPNRALLVDGSWGTIDGRSLGEEIAALDELHEGILADHLAARLGWAMAAHHRAHCDLPRYELCGVDTALLREFSRSSMRIQAATDELVAMSLTRTGRALHPREIHRLRHVAARRTRPVRHPRALDELVSTWRARAADRVGDDPAAWVAQLAAHELQPARRHRDLDDDALRTIVERAVAAVYARRSAPTVTRLAAEVRRQLRRLRFSDADERIAAAEHVTRLVTRPAMPAA